MKAAIFAVLFLVAFPDAGWGKSREAGIRDLRNCGLSFCDRREKTAQNTPRANEPETEKPHNKSATDPIDSIRSGFKRMFEKPHPKPSDEKNVVPLDTKFFPYVVYFKRIREKINENWRWPKEARHSFGAVVLKFVVKKDGTLKNVSLVKSSGHKMLDDGVVSAIEKAAPFNPFPESLKRESVEIKSTFSYENFKQKNSR